MNLKAEESASEPGAAYSRARGTVNNVTGSRSTATAVSIAAVILIVPLQHALRRAKRRVEQGCARDC